MKHPSTIILLFLTILLLASGCVSEPGLDKTKFADLGRTAEAIKTAVTSSNPCDAPEALEHSLASGIAAVNDRADSKLDQYMITAYTHLLSTYRDGLLLCRSRHQLSNVGYFPKGRVYVSQDLDAVVEKYDLSTEKQQDRRTGVWMRTIDGDSIQEIWESAQAQIRNIEVTMKYN